MADIGTAYVRIAPNMTGIQGKIASGFKGAGTQATNQLGNEIQAKSGGFQSALGKLGSAAKVGGLAIASGIAAGAAGLGALATKMLLANSQLEQQLGGSEAVFGKNAKNIQKIAQDAYKNMGLSQNEFLAGANKMGSLYQGAGHSVQSSMKMSADSIQRATDVASIMGIDTTTALESVTAMAKGNFTMMDNLGVAMNDTSLNAYALEKGLGKTTAQMSIQEKTGLATQLFMEKTAKFAGNYAKENDTLAGSINTTKKAFDDFLSGGGDIGNFVDSLVNTIKIAVPKIVEILPKLVNGLGAILTGLVPVLSKAMPVLIPALIKAAQNLLNALIAALPSVIQTLLQALPMFISAFIQLFMALVKALPQIIAIISASMPAIINALVVGLTNPTALTAMIMGSIMLFMAMLKAIPVIVSALVRAVPTIVRNIVKTLTSPQFLAAMSNAGVQLVQSTISGIVKMGSAVARAAWEVVKIIGRTLAPGSLMSIGSDLIKGLWNGISSMGSWLKDKLISFVKDKIPGPVRKALGIHSPSKVFAELGKNVDQGMALGIDKYSGMVERSASGMADSAMAGIYTPDVNSSVAFGSSVAAAGGVGQNNNTTNTTEIKNVYLGNADAVKEFFKQLNQDTINAGMGISLNQGAQP